MEDLQKLTKEDLIKKCISLNASCKYQQNVIINKNTQINHFRRRLKKVINSLDYLLQHPYSLDNSNKTLRHKRETNNKKSKLDGLGFIPSESSNYR